MLKIFSLLAAAGLIFGGTTSSMTHQEKRPVTEVRLMTLDPGHFHAALVQKRMYPGVSSRVSIYAPLGFDLTEHLNRIARFNLRKQEPTTWQLDVHTGPDFFQRMLTERPGNVVIISGRNQGKIDRIKTCVESGLDVLADKPWIISHADLPKLESLLKTAGLKKIIAYDIMTERYEITTVLQRELINDPAVFGAIISGTQKEPGVYMESVHHLYKAVAGAPNLRPAWFFDVEQQGEGLADIGTHLVDLIQWMLFPEQSIEYRKDINVLAANRWPTRITKEQFHGVTAEADFPQYLSSNVKAGQLDFYCNGDVSYTLRGIHAGVKVIWNYEAPEGAGDSHFAVFRGTRCRLEIRQGKEEKYRPELYVIPNSSETRSQVLAGLRSRLASIQSTYPGIAFEERGDRIHITIPDRFREGHEEHFGRVTEQFLKYLRDRNWMPRWEGTNMLAKYYVTTKAVEMSRGSN